MHTHTLHTYCTSCIARMHSTHHVYAYSMFVNRPPGSHLPLPTNDDPPNVCPGGCIMFVCRPGVAGCPRRLPNKKLTKSYTRYPVVVLGGPVRRSL